MSHSKTGLLLGALLVVTSATAPAAILGMQQLKLDFTTPTVAQQASWTRSENLKLGPKGLIHQAPGPESIDFTLQTTQPLATGVSWRPARGVSIRARLSPVASSIKLGNGQTYTPAPGRLFVRYSPDARHWSRWQVLAITTEPTAYRFTGEIAIAQQDSAEYDALVSKYSSLDVPWKSDEEACVQWILSTQPDFFAKHLPFVGYVQFLYEGSLAGGQRIEHLDLDVSYGLGGLHLAPKDAQLAKGRDGPWRFRAP